MFITLLFSPSLINVLLQVRLIDEEQVKMPENLLIQSIQARERRHSSKAWTEIKVKKKKTKKHAEGEIQENG